MKIDILGGENEIGGNKILVSHRGKRILLDFGLSNISRYYSGYLQPRKCSALEDFLSLGFLPEMKGVYREDYLRHAGKPGEKAGIDALFLTHAHLDHAGAISFLREDIPIYCTKPTKTILQAIEDTGSSLFPDLVTACRAFQFYENKDGRRSRATSRNEEFVAERPYSLMSKGRPVKIGGLEIEAVPVDHSLPGACGFIVYSDAGNLVYTGDIRFHGLHSRLSDEFVERAVEAKPRWLVCEGTRVCEANGRTEQDVRREIGKLARRQKGLVVFEQPVRDLDRLESFYSAAESLGRKLAINLKQAYLLDLLQRDGIDCPRTEDKNIRIFIPRKGWGLVGNRKVPEYQIEQDYSSWERAYLKHRRRITAQDIRSEQQKYLLFLNLWDLPALLDIQPKKESIAIKSMCEPFTDEMELNEATKQNWLAYFNLPVYDVHASGHADKCGLQDMIKKIKPKKLIPIHTEYPGVLAELNR
jgi:ribonuclease J